MKRLSSGQAFPLRMKNQLPQRDHVVYVEELRGNPRVVKTST